MFIHCYTLLFVVLTISWLARASSYMGSSNNLLLDELTKSCPSDGIPVCGIRHKQFFLFPNDCLLQEVNKDILLGEANFKKIPLKYCMYGCQFSCAKIYQPICARNMRSYKNQMFVNQCELTKYVCQTNADYLKISYSECQRSARLRNANKMLEKRSQTLKRKRRPIPCTNIFKPVCGSYMGVKSSFRNECLLNAENVKFNRDWRIVKNGMCAEDYSNSRKRKEKPEKPHSIKKRSFENNFYPQHTNEQHDPDYNTNNNFENYKNQANLSPNDLYLYMPPAFQTQYLNHDSQAYHDPIPVHKAYDEIFNKMMSLLPPPTSNIQMQDMESEEETHKLEDPMFQESVIKPMPFAANMMNFNYITERNHNINRSPSLSIDVNSFMDKENNKDYYEIEKVAVENENKEIEDIPTTFPPTSETSPETTKTSSRIAATKSRPKVSNKHLKTEKVSNSTKECKFGSTSICGMLADGSVRTFETICEMMTANVYLKNTWTKLHEGVCEDCKYNCSRDYQPICVTRNGVNYTMVNECYFNMGICMDKKSKWQKLSDSECERYTRIPDKYANSKPGFPYTSNYFVTQTTPIPSTDSLSLDQNPKLLKLKYRKSKKRNFNPKRAVSRRSNSHRCCSRSHYRNQFGHDNMKCKCWADTTLRTPTTRLALHEPQTESYIMRLVKDKVERGMMP
ncbi:hypothetical protein CVS40_0253 [Lucilia cuprina]|nr:hypothetical protein CVS40_0253 [Lucilia cuprina]